MSYLYDMRSGNLVKSKLINNGLLLKDSLDYGLDSLFSDGKSGFWYDPSDLTTMFKDIQMSQPVASDGDRVAVILDKSGNNRHLVQSNPSYMPVYKTDGVYHWIESDGVDDMLVSSAFDLSVGSISLIAAFKRIGTSTPLMSIVGRPNQGINFSSNSLHTRPLINTTSHGVFFSFDDSISQRVYTVLLNQSTRRFSGFVNSEAQGVKQITSAAWYDDPSQIIVGANRLINPSYSNSSFYGAVMVQNLMSDEDRVLVVQYLAEKSGITL